MTKKLTLQDLTIKSFVTDTVDLVSAVQGGNRLSTAATCAGQFTCGRECDLVPVSYYPQGCTYDC